MRLPQKLLKHPLAWVSTSYFAEGIPFALVIWVAGTMFKDMGHTDGQITLATASVGIAWSLKPLWAAFLDMFRSKRFFVILMEVLMALLCAGVALALPVENYFQITIAVLWVMAFASATQDICVDGIYITTLDKAEQAQYIGLQGVGWNVGKIFSTAAIVWLAGTLQESGSHTAASAWSIAWFACGATFVALAAWHRIALPKGASARKVEHPREVLHGFLEAWIDFFKKKQIWGMLLFVFLFRSAEGLLLLVAPLFMQSSLEDGGLGLTLIQKGMIDGTVSTVVSLAGGILGGAFISRYGLKRSLFFMALCLNVPNLCYVYLSWAVSPDAPLSLTTITTLVTIEKFGYSFGFVANMLYMMQQISPGRFHMTHYAFCTALMNLVLVPTQMVSGPLADMTGYRVFFIIVCVATIPSLIVALKAPFPRAETAKLS